MSEYKGYEPETTEQTPTPMLSLKASPEDMPDDIKKIFDKLNSTGLSHPRDPLCVDLNYMKGKSPWLVSAPAEKRVPGTPQEIEQKYQEWYLNDWKQKSRLSKICSILWYLPSHLYRKYLASLDYRWYYSGLVSYLQRARDKLQ